MVRYEQNGETYILRWDNWVMELLEEDKEHGGMMQAVNLNARNTDGLMKVFRMMAKSGADYTGMKVSDNFDLITKHTSIGRIRKILKAVTEAMKDGNEMRFADDDDDKVRDAYLEEIEAEERKKK